ncbi:MAG: hypothetical protein JWP45_2908 [Mucilaginibacter sp.]|nr:hypothetical protein [Mucilaginibacter sp.]
MHKTNVLYKQNTPLLNGFLQGVFTVFLGGTWGVNRQLLKEYRLKGNFRNFN